MDIVKSRTTQNQVAGTATVSGVVWGAIQMLRNYWPDMPGDESSDAAIVVLIVTFAGPWLSRTFAFLRNPEKKGL